ncbi:MAG: phenylalanine--tRNA ligase subunit alpha, partial [Alphaproteobacteria bacterium]
MSIENILSDFNSHFENLQNQAELEEIRVRFLGKKSALNDLFLELKNLSPDEKKSFGAKINEVRNFITQKIDEKKVFFENIELAKKLQTEKIDISAPVRSQNQGLIHPINKVMADIENIFNALGFEFA